MIDRATVLTQAALLRDKMGEDNNSPVDVFALAQNIEGLTIVFYPLGNNLSGICIKGRENNNLIAVNSGMTYGRQRFSLAHEFYHLYYDNNMFTVCAISINTGTENERKADMFASYFLMPETALAKMANSLIVKNGKNKLLLEDLIRIEQYFGISHQAAICRLKDSRFLDEEEANNYAHCSVRNKSEELGYSSHLYRSTPKEKQCRTFGNYIKQAGQVLSEGIISEGKYEELLLEAFRADLVYGIEEEGDVID